MVAVDTPAFCARSRSLSLHSFCLQFDHSHTSSQSTTCEAMSIVDITINKRLEFSFDFSILTQFDFTNVDGSHATRGPEPCGKYALYVKMGAHNLEREEIPRGPPTQSSPAENHEHASQEHPAEERPDPATSPTSSSSTWPTCTARDADLYAAASSPSFSSSRQ